MDQDIFSFHPEDERVCALCASDPRLEKLIGVIGPFSLQLQRNFYEALVKKIIGQQLSVKAAGTIWGRVSTLFSACDPESVQAVSDDDFRSAGVSKAKISYIRDLTGKVVSGDLNLDSLHRMEDEEVVRVLTGVKGIGRWTVEMFLIFSLGRLDVFSEADVGLQRAIGWLYGGEVEHLPMVEAWSPYKTIASLYLWEVINQGLIQDYGSVDEVLR